jgi:hypothetical protein
MPDLDAPLYQTPIPAATRNEVINQFWDRKDSLQLQHDDLDWDPYFTYYTDQCVQALNDRGRHVSARSHQDLVDLVQLLKDDYTKLDIKTALQTSFATSKSTEEKEQMLEGSINLAGRLLSMMDIGELRLGYTGRRPIVWDNDCGIKETIGHYLSQPQRLSHESVKFEKIFNARNLGRIAGMNIVWTTNLADHLRIMSDDDKQVAIFHYASFLKWQQRYHRAPPP